MFRRAYPERDLLRRNLFVVRGTGKSYWMPVIGFFKDTITTDLSGEELKALVHSVFPAITFIDHDQL